MIVITIHWSSLFIGLVFGFIGFTLTNYFYHRPTSSIIFSVKCKSCNGSGLVDKVEPSKPIKCFKCGGTGYLDTE